MKKLLFIAAIVFGTVSLSQNNFPSNGQVTIGTATASPGSALDVNGSVRIDSSLTVKDSLVVENRIRAKDKLIVDDKAIFKNDAVVKMDLRVNGNTRIDSVLRVDGTTKLNGDVKMENLNSYNGNLENVELLLVQANGQVKKATILGLSQYLGVLGDALACMGDGNGNIPLADWVRGFNKVYVCPGVKVGVGVSDPIHEVQIVGIASAQRYMAGNPLAPNNALYNGYTSSSDNLIEVGRYNGPQTAEVRFRIKNSGATEIYNSSSDASIVINNGTGHAMIVNNSGGSKIFQMENSGLIRAREIKVDLATNWPDYVFDVDYKLLKLEEVERYIAINKKLPNVPSAIEIQRDGINIGEMQKIHMQKIEELTLYSIQLNNQIQTVKEENQLLKTELQMMKKEMSEIKEMLVKK